MHFVFTQSLPYRYFGSSHHRRNCSESVGGPGPNQRRISASPVRNQADARAGKGLQAHARSPPRMRSLHCTKRRIPSSKHCLECFSKHCFFPLLKPSFVRGKCIWWLCLYQQLVSRGVPATAEAMADLGAQTICITSRLLLENHPGLLSSIDVWPTPNFVYTS